jgi:hypothetical protein
MAQEVPASSFDQAVGLSALDAAVVAHESAAESQRNQVTEFLARPDVQEVARDRGIDMARVNSAAAGLSDAELKGVAPLIAEPVATLQSGGTITVSVAAVIIILLILILVT